MQHRLPRRLGTVALSLAVLVVGVAPAVEPADAQAKIAVAPESADPPEAGSAPAASTAPSRANFRIGAQADAYVDRSHPRRNTGKKRSLLVRRNPSVISLVKVKVPAGIGEVTGARLRLRVKSKGAARLIVREAGNRWNEGKVNWRNRPDVGAVVARKDFGGGGRRWVGVDLSDHVRGPGTYTFALTTLRRDRITFSSSESDHSPALIVTATDPPRPPTERVRFAAGGDFGLTDDTEATMASIGAGPAQFLLALGDLSYGDSSEGEWCNFVKGHLGNQFPVEIVVGNHEDDDRPDGVFIDNFAACLPDRMNSTGRYATEYYFDVGKLARVIMIGADNDVHGDKHDYEIGTAHYNWLRRAIDNARAAGIGWVIVGMHKVCITAGNKPCEVGAELYDLLLSRKVDLILHGHEHDYQRSKQLACATPEQYRPNCVTDDGSDDRYPRGAGSVFVINGLAGGGGITDIDSGDPDFGYLAAWHGDNSPDAGRGYLALDVNQDRLIVEFVGSTTSYTDRIVIG